MSDLETTIQSAQKITLGQVDNGTLATAVTCAESIAIVRHGRVESYLVPKHLIDEMFLKNAVLECDNKRLLGEKVAESITVPKSHFFNVKFPVDIEAVKNDDLGKSNLEEAIFKAHREMVAMDKRQRELSETPYCRYCLDPNCQRDDHCLFDRHLNRPLVVVKNP